MDSPLCGYSLNIKPRSFIYPLSFATSFDPVPSLYPPPPRMPPFPQNSSWSSLDAATEGGGGPSNGAAAGDEGSGGMQQRGDPLAKWFEAHYTQLHAGGGSLGSHLIGFTPGVIAYSNLSLHPPLSATLPLTPCVASHCQRPSQAVPAALPHSGVLLSALITAPPLFHRRPPPPFTACRQAIPAALRHPRVRRAARGLHL